LKRGMDKEKEGEEKFLVKRKKRRGVVEKDSIRK
jgi:hypothetical protein